METLFEFFRTITSIRAFYLLLIVGMIGGFIWWFRGIFPVLIRLGNGLAKRNVAIFAKSDNFTVLNNLLTGSALFSKKNIVSITQEGDIGEAERVKATVYLLQWEDWADSYQKVLNKIPDGCALIIYAPHPSKIPNDDIAVLALQRNVTVTNFRGRLLNDIVTSMITTGYERK